MEIDRFQRIDHGWHQALSQREGGIVLGIAADLQHSLADLRKGRGEIGRGCRLPDPALAIDCEDLGAFNLHVRVELNLDAAFSVFTLVERGRGVFRHTIHSAAS